MPRLTFRKVSDGLSREEVAKAMGVTVERIRQIEEGALEKCKRILESQGYSLKDLVP